MSLAFAFFACKEQPMPEKVKIQMLKEIDSLDQLATQYNVKDDLTNTLDCRLKILERLDQMSPSRTVTNLKAANYSKLGNLFLKIFDETTAVECWKEAFDQYLLLGNSPMLFVHATVLAVESNRSDDTVTSYYYCHIADSLKSIMDEDELESVTNHICHINRVESYLLFDSGHKKEAYAKIRQHLADEKDENLFNYYESVLAEFFYDDKQYDSAIVHYQNSIKIDEPSVPEEISNMIECYKAIGDQEKADQYTAMLANITVEEYGKTSEKTQLTARYKQYKMEKANRETHKRRYFTYNIVILLVAVSLIILLIIHYKKKKRKKLEQQHNEWYTNMLQGKMRKTTEELHDKEEQIKQLKSELEKNENPQKLPVVIPFEEKMQTLMEAPICKQIHNMLDNKQLKVSASYPDLQLTDKQQAQLIKAVDDVFSRFSFRLTQSFSRITNADILCCCMLLIGLDERQIAVLLGKTYQTVWARCNKLHEIFDSKLPIKEILADWVSNW